ncbi:MAG: trp operon repressor [Gammaproteobacteria bacterium]|nr:trp operon repressor [Gammaproteobacteria bacterium]
MKKNIITLNFIDLVLSIKDKKECALLLDLFLTEEEKKNIELRYLIIKELLKNKKTQREIAKDIGVSIAKITRGSNELKRMNKKFIIGLKRKLEE